MLYMYSCIEYESKLLRMTLDMVALRLWLTVFYSVLCFKDFIRKVMSCLPINKHVYIQMIE